MCNTYIYIYIGAMMPRKKYVKNEVAQAGPPRC